MIIPIIFPIPENNDYISGTDPPPFMYILILILALTFVGVLIGYHYGMNPITGTKIIFGIGFGEILIMTIWAILS